MQIINSLSFQNVYKPLSREKLKKKLHCFITNEFFELCEGWAPINSCIFKISMGAPFIWTGAVREGIFNNKNAIVIWFPSAVQYWD